MKRLFLPLIFFVVCVAPAVTRADTLFLWPNTGIGDNFGYIGQMNGHQFVLSGGTGYWFFDISGYDPGSAFGGQTELFLYSTTVWVNGAPVDIGFPSPSATLFMTSFTLPTNGQDFKMLVQISFSATGINPDLPQSVALSGFAQGWIDFHHSNGRYYSSNFVQTTVPEPGTLGLIGTGLIGVIAAVRRRLG